MAMRRFFLLLVVVGLLVLPEPFLNDVLYAGHKSVYRVLFIFDIQVRRRQVKVIRKTYMIPKLLKQFASQTVELAGFLEPDIASLLNNNHQV